MHAQSCILIDLQVSHCVEITKIKIIKESKLIHMELLTLTPISDTKGIYTTQLKINIKHLRAYISPV